MLVNKRFRFIYLMTLICKSLVKREDTNVLDYVDHFDEPSADYSAKDSRHLMVNISRLAYFEQG